MADCYLYCVLNTAEAVPANIKGMCESGVECISYRGVRVLYSVLGTREMNISLENLKIHNSVSAFAMELGTVIPFQFGTAVKSEKEVLEIVKGMYPQFMGSFTRLDGRAEMGIKVFEKEENKGCSSIKENSSALKRLEAVSEKSGPVNYLINKIRHIEEKRISRQYALELYDELMKPLIDISDDNTTAAGEHGRMLINSAFLIRKDMLEEFRKRFVHMKQDNPAYIFICSGPWPPYNFTYISEVVEKSG